MWLNEGFASYVEYLGAEHVAPTSGIMDRFSVREIQTTFEYDSLQSSHPISIQVQHPDEIGQIFDSISYGKGASIIRMMANFLGIKTFNLGITNYLKQHKYENAQQDDLWQSLTDVAIRERTLKGDVNVKEIMDTWTLQMGYPVVNVQRNYETNDIKLNQERFLLFKDASVKDEHEYRWWVPISCTHSDGDFSHTETNLWLKPNDVDTPAKDECNVPADTALVINIQQTGYYRVNYDVENWNLIYEALKQNMSSIHRINRAQIIDDAMNLARAGSLEYDIALKLVDYFKQETEYIPWKARLRSFRYIRKMLARTPAYGLYKQYMSRELKPVYSSLFNEQGKVRDNDVMDSLLRVEIMNEMCEMDQDECKKNALNMLKSEEKIQIAEQYLSSDDGTGPILVNRIRLYSNNVANFVDIEKNTMKVWRQAMERGTAIPAEFRGVTYCTFVKEGNEEDWEYVWGMYTKTSNVNMKRNILSGLGCSRHIWILKVRNLVVEQ